ncbi:MAG: cytoplasmic protein [Rhodospirillaceae bacterium]|nr:cytoplasmic protein [Rhodospirillaceae bacterium]
MPKRKVLLAGESWTSTATHIKGFDQFATASFHLGAEPLAAALADSDFALRYMPAHEAQRDFPLSLEALRAYDAVILSDIGSNTLLLHPDTFALSRRMPNRLRLIRDYVAAGGGLMMIGGYYSFQGINGGARYHGTPVEEVLPVEILPWDDRVEVPEGFVPVVADRRHPVVEGLRGPWPPLLGFNEVKAKPGGHVIATAPADYRSLPLLVAGSHGRGRTLAWTSDIGPHWLPPEFVAWKGYRRLWIQALEWLTGAR